MPTWQPDQYLAFEEERTRPCRDLAAAIQFMTPRSIIDLGCGPGNSTGVLSGRWPGAQITGLDSSREMLARAHREKPQINWICDDIAAWAASADSQYDVVFSNAALQWVANHAKLYPQLFGHVTPGGVLAVQVPSNVHEAAHESMRELARSARWQSFFSAGSPREWFVHDASHYYEILSPLAHRIDLWETTYFHVMPGVEAITEWYRGTGLRPFLDVLPDAAVREQFCGDYTAKIGCHYQPQGDGRVLFPFRRLFLIAHAKPA